MNRKIYLGPIIMAQALSLESHTSRSTAIQLAAGAFYLWLGFRELDEEASPREKPEVAE